MIERNQINRISRGYYGLVDYNVDEYYQIISMSEKAIFSMNTALYLHNMSDRTPLVFDITVPYYYGGNLRKNKKVNLYFVNSLILDLGKVELISPFGMKIKVYDKERTICDIVKNRNNMDMEIFSKAIKNYIKCDDKKLNKLIQNQGYIVLIKNGTFYGGIGKDAVLMNQILNYKPVCFKENICKCGIPVSTLNCNNKSI